MKNKIAFYGNSGSGKDFVAECVMNDLHWIHGCYCERFAFADPVKMIVGYLLGMNFEQSNKFYHDKDFKNHTLIDLKNLSIIVESDVNHENPEWSREISSEELNRLVKVEGNDYRKFPELNRTMSLREFIVYFGTYVMQYQFGPNIWVNSILNSDSYKKILDSNAKDWKKNNVAVITDVRFPHEFDSLKKEGFVFVKIVDTENQHQEISNIAEKYYDTFKPDFVFENDKYDRNNFSRERNRLLNWLNNVNE